MLYMYSPDMPLLNIPDVLAERTLDVIAEAKVNYPTLVVVQADTEEQAESLGQSYLAGTATLNTITYAEGIVLDCVCSL